MPDKEENQARSIRAEESEFQQELKLSDKLAIERTVMAADRTMLAGVRTSMALIGFGFTIFNILKYLQQNSPMKELMRQQTPRNIGGFMLLVGVIPLFVMVTQYARTLKRMGSKESIVSNPNFQMAIAILLLGTILLIALIGNILLL
jgi:putative membrane protein